MMAERDQALRWQANCLILVGQIVVAPKRNGAYALNIKVTRA
jgi:hypothetical protein